MRLRAPGESGRKILRQEEARSDLGARTAPAPDRQPVSRHASQTGGIVIHPGDRLENPATGEILVFHHTSEETNGESVVIETIVRPGGYVAATHVHPFQTERFEVLAGMVGFRIDGRELVARQGDELVVEPGTPHRFWNAGESEARFLAEVKPALRFESLVETMFTLAAEGKTNRKGLPNPFRLAVIARAHFDTVRLPFPPVWAQRVALGVGASVGKLLGYPETVSRESRTL
jgi:quercetin dioxygenase-like cupin family protein